LEIWFWLNVVVVLATTLGLSEVSVTVNEPLALALAGMPMATGAFCPTSAPVE